MADQKFEVMLDLSIPMRDGVHLHGVLYRPSEGDKFPVLLLRTPYNAEFPDWSEWGPEFVQNGYAVVMQDVRGRNMSDGKVQPYIQEINDGYDTQQWIGAQPWCDGNIGTFGISYSGFTQILPAPLRCSYVKALVPVGNQVDNYGHLRYNGLLQLENAINWVWWGNRMTYRVPKQLIDWDQLYRGLPLISALDHLGDRPFYREIIRHELYDDFWKATSLKDKYGEVDVPAYFITGWYDNLLHETFKNFIGWKTHARTPEARAQTKLLVGPWSHYTLGSDERFGDIEFGPAAVKNLPAVHLRWYDQRLKSLNTGIDEEPALRLFVMGDNIWRDENEWPLARTQFENFYLHSRGQANSLDGDGELSREQPGNEPPDNFTYDPENPVLTWGGQSQLMEYTGPKDRRDIERRDDVLVYSTAPLANDLEITGPLEMTLYAASSAPDTDFTATLVDVHPDEKTIHISEGIVRARFRQSYTEPSLIEPGKVYEYKFVLWETSNVFKAGHRIRVEISSSNFPRFDRNLNTGHPAGMDAELQVAQQTIYHNSQYPSHIILPVIPR